MAPYYTRPGRKPRYRHLNLMTLMNAIKKYFYNVLVSIDQFANTLLGGDMDETISSRMGKIKRKGGGRIPRWRIITRLADWALDKIDPGHSTKAIEEDEGKDAVLDKM